MNPTVARLLMGTAGGGLSPFDGYLAVAHASSPYMTLYKKYGDTLLKIAGPATNPQNSGGLNGIGLSWSVDGTYLAVATDHTPYIYVYKRSGDTLTKLSDPATIPNGACYDCAISPNGTYLAVVGNISTSDPGPWLYVYKRSGDTFTLLNSPGSASAPNYIGRGACWSADSVYLSVPSEALGYLTPVTYKRSGDVFSIIDYPSNWSGGGFPASKACGFSYDMNYYSYTRNASPWVVNCKRSGDNWVKLTNPSTLPTGLGRGVAYGPTSLDSQPFVAIAHDNYPYLTVYSYNGTTFTFNNMPVLPPSTGYDVSWDAPGSRLVVAHASSPYITVYKRNGYSFTKLTDPVDLPPSTGISVAFWPPAIGGS